MRSERKEGVRKEDGPIGTEASFTISKLVLTQKLRSREPLSGCAQFCSAIQISRMIFPICPGWKLMCLKASTVLKSIQSLLPIVNSSSGPRNGACGILPRVDVPKKATSDKLQAIINNS